MAILHDSSCRLFPRYRRHQRKEEVEHRFLEIEKAAAVATEVLEHRPKNREMQLIVRMESPFRASKTLTKPIKESITYKCIFCS